MRKKKLLAYLLAAAILLEGWLPAYAAETKNVLEAGKTETFISDSEKSTEEVEKIELFSESDDGINTKGPDYILGREMTKEEIEAQKAMVSKLTPMDPVKLDSDDLYAGLDITAFEEFETKYDLRNMNLLTPVKDQNPWGTCWSFSTMALMESSLIRQGLETQDSIDLSERHLAYFTGNSGYDILGNANGDTISHAEETYYLNSGGNIDTAAMRLMNWQGAAEEEKYPYSYEMPEDIARENAQDVRAITKDIYLVPTQGASVEDEVRVVKSLINEYGCVWWSYHHADEYCNYSTGAIYCNNPELEVNHAITIVGWDDEYSKENFLEDCQPENDGAWIMRNSWGEGYADEGYFYISYEDVVLGEGNVAGVLVAAEPEEYDNNYFYSNGIYQSYYPETWEISQVFETKSGAEKEGLKAVSFMLASAGESYEIQVYKNPEMADGIVTNPESGEAMYETPVKGETGYPGVYTVDIPQVILEKGDIFAVVVTFTDADGASIYFDATYKDEYVQKYNIAKSVNETQAGQSFRHPKPTSWAGGLYEWGWEDLHNKEDKISIRLNALTEDISDTVPNVEYEVIGAKDFTDTQINEISWTECIDAEKYEIYRSESRNGTYNKLAEVPGDMLTYQDKLQIEDWNTTYYYKVNSVYSDETITSSKIIRIVGENALRMTEVVVNKEGTNNVICWEEMAGAEGYVLERKLGEEEAFSELMTVSGGNITQYTDVLDGTEGEVSYRIKAYMDETITSLWSEEITAPAANVERMELDFGSNLMTKGEKRNFAAYRIIDGERYLYTGELKWSADSGDGTFYDVVLEGNIAKIIGSDGKEILRIDEKELEVIGESKEKEVRLTASVGDFKMDAVISILLPVSIEDITPLDAGSIQLVWSSAGENESYNIYRSEENEENYQLLEDKITRNIYIDEAVKTGVIYYYKIQLVKEGITTLLEMTDSQNARTLPDKAKILEVTNHSIMIENDTMCEYAISKENVKEQLQYVSDNSCEEIVFDDLEAEQTYFIFTRLQKDRSIYGETAEITLSKEGGSISLKDEVLEYWIVNENEILRLSDVVEKNPKEVEGGYTYSLKDFEIRECMLQADSEDVSEKEINLKVYGLKQYAELEKISVITDISELYKLEEIPAESLRFVSVNPAVAQTTQDGKIKAIGEGETLIYVYGKTTKERYGRYRVKVTGTNAVEKIEAMDKKIKLSAVTKKIYLEQFGHHSNSSAILEIKDKQGNKYPAHYFTYVSADSEVCLVDENGKVTVNPSYCGTKNKTVKITAILKNDAANRKVKFNVCVYGKQQTAGIDIYYKEEAVQETALAYQKGEKINLSMKAYGSNGKEIENPKVKWKVSNAAVASIKVNKDGSAVVTIKKPGQCRIICTSSDSFKTSGTLLLKAIEVTPVLNKENIKLESQMLTTEGYKTTEKFTLTGVYGADYGEVTITAVKLGKQTLKTEDFLIVKNADDSYQIKVKEEILRGIKNNSKIAVTLCAEVLGLKENVEFNETEFTVKLQVLTKEPAIKVKEAGTINRYYTSGEAIKSLLNIETVQEIQNIEVAKTQENKEFASSFEVVKQDEKWYLQLKNSKDYTKNSSKGSILITLNGYEPIEKTIMVKTPNKVPKIVQQNIPVISTVSTKEENEAEIRLLNQTNNILMKNMKIVEVIEASKARINVGDDGSFVFGLKKEEYYNNNENVTAKVKVQETDTEGNAIWLAPLEITLNVQVSTNLPKITVEKKQVTLNIEADTEEAMTKLEVDCKNVSMNDILQWRIQEYNSVSGLYDVPVDWLEMEYEENTELLSMKLKGVGKEGGHKVRISNLLEGFEEIYTDMTVNVIKQQPSASVRLSGKLDITNKSACSIVGKITLKNAVAEEIAAAEIVEDDRFEVKLKDKNQIILQVTEEGKQENAIQAEKQKLHLSIILPGGKKIDTTMQITPVCTLPKLTVPEVKTLYKSILKQSVEYDLGEQLTKGVEITKIEEVETSTPFLVEIEGGKIRIRLKEEEKGIQAGIYKVKVNVFFKDAPQKPQTKIIKVKVVE